MRILCKDQETYDLLAKVSKHYNSGMIERASIITVDEMVEVAKGNDQRRYRS